MNRPERLVDLLRGDEAAQTGERRVLTAGELVRHHRVGAGAGAVVVGAVAGVLQAPLNEADPRSPSSLQYRAVSAYADEVHAAAAAGRAIAIVTS